MEKVWDNPDTTQIRLSFQTGHMGKKGKNDTEGVTEL